MRNCSCSPSAITRYQKRIYGPLLDRIGISIHMEVWRIEYEKLSDRSLVEPSARVRERVQEARERQRQRFKSNGTMLNADPSVSSGQAWAPAELQQYCPLGAAGYR